MNKRMDFVHIIFILTFLFFLAACGGKSKENFISGIFEGKAESLMGNISVRVHIEKNKIKNIDILEYSDTPGYSDTVFEFLPKKIIESNSTDVDIIGGATITSKALLDAVNDALKKAAFSADEKEM